MRYLFIVLTFFHVKAYAQTEENRVKSTVLSLFQGMKNADSTILKSVFAPGAQLHTVGRNKEGQIFVRAEDVNEFIATVSKPHSEVYDERISFEMVRIDNDLATVWTPYQFYVGEQFSHCGVNSFQLVRLNGEWRILYLIDTRRKERCN